MTRVGKALRPLVGDLRQLASVRRIVLDEGPETGVGAMLFSTGGGLDFMVLADRTLDIGTISYRGVPLAWQSHAGFRHPSLSRGRDFDELFSGFLITCGLEHIRQPGNGSPLHGRLPVTPARLTSCGEDWDVEEPYLFCEGEVLQASYGKDAFRLRRRIESPIGSTRLRIIDRVENFGAEAAAQAMLYHFNLGFPAIQKGTTVKLDETPLGQPWSPSADPPGVVACVSAGAEAFGRCVVTTPQAAGDLTVVFAFSSDTLPFLQVFQDQGRGLLAIEPCTSQRGEGGISLNERQLGPRETREYRVEVSVAGSSPAWQPG